MKAVVGVAREWYVTVESVRTSSETTQVPSVRPVGSSKCGYAQRVQENSSRWAKFSVTHAEMAMGGPRDW